VKPDIRIFPARDQAFRVEVERTVASLDAGAADGEVPDPRALVELLRPHYPNMTVNSRDDLGSVGGQQAMWYGRSSSRR
jgi:hypothetical protein